MRKKSSCPGQTGHRVPPEFEYDPVPALISGGLPSGLCFESSQLFLLSSCESFAKFFAFLFSFALRASFSIR